MILVLYAFSGEVAAFKRRLQRRRSFRTGTVRGFTGTVDGTDVIAIATGVGMARASAALDTALREFATPALVISTGVAGGLASELRPGDIVLANRFIVSAEHDELDTPFDLPLEDVARAEAALSKGDIRLRTGTIFTSRKAIATGPDKAHWRSVTGALAVEMESGVIAREAIARGIPFLCLRAVLDHADEELLGAELADGDIGPLAAAAMVLRSPSMWVKLPRLIRNLKLAARSLDRAVATIVRAA